MVDARQESDGPRLMRVRDAAVIALASSLLAAALTMGTVHVHRNVDSQEAPARPIAEISSRKRLLDEMQARVEEKERIVALSSENHLALERLAQRLNELGAQNVRAISP